MRIIVNLCAATTFAALSVPLAQAAPYDLTSKIDAVTVFPAGALVTRSATIDIEAGSSTLTFKNLPDDLDANSLRVSGIADSDMAIDSVATHLTAADNKPGGTNESRMQDLKSQRELVQVEIGALEARKNMALHFARTVPKELAGDAKPLAVSDWPGAFDTVADALRKTGAALSVQRAKARDLDRQIKALEQVSNGNNSDVAPHREVDVEVHAAKSLKGRVTLTYRIAQAGWRPVYDARLDTGSANRKPSLELVRRASVSQHSGEDWNAIALTVSTLRATGATSAPDMQTQKLAFFEPAPPPMPAPPADAMRSYAAPRPAAKAAAAPDMAEPERKLAATETQSQAQLGDYQAAFTIPGRINLATDGSAKTFSIATRAINPELLIKSVPALDQTAYLETHFTNEDAAPLLAGEVGLYRNGDYIGAGAIAFAAPGETLDLGFGADDRVKISRLPVKRRENEPNWFGQTKTEAREYRTTVKNLHDFPVKIALIDQVPVSENTAITIDQLPATTPPTEKTIANKRGVIGWTYDYAPEQTREIHLAYRMKWPADREVTTESVPATQ